MTLSAFDDKSQQPTQVDLDKMLGRTQSHWDRLTTYLAAEYPPLDQSWNFAGAAWGWSLRLKQKKRTVLYLTPLAGSFLAGFALGEKAVRAAHDGGLPDSVLALIDGAKKYAEGRAVRLEVKTAKDLEAVKALAAVKMAN